MDAYDESMSPPSPRPMIDPSPEAMIDAPPLQEPPSQVRVALASRDRGMITRDDGRKVRVATSMTKQMFEARCADPGKSPAERKAEVQKLKERYLERYGLPDEDNPGKLRFPNIQDPRDQVLLAKTHGAIVMAPVSESSQQYRLARGYGFSYPSNRIKGVRGCERFPIDEQTLALVMKMEKKHQSTSLCMMPLVNLAVPTPTMAAYLVSPSPVQGVMDSFDLLNRYMSYFLILTRGFGVDVKENPAFLTEERVLEIQNLNQKGRNMRWPQIEKSLNMPRQDIPGWFLAVLRQALHHDRAHFLYSLKTRYPDLVNILLQGRKLSPDEAERIMVQWAATAHFDMIGRTIQTLNQRCKIAYEKFRTSNGNLSNQYLRQLHLISEEATWGILMAYDVTFLRLLSRYVPMAQWGQFAPRYHRVKPEHMEQWQAANIRRQRKQISDRRAYFLSTVPKAVQAQSPKDLIWPDDKSSPTWSDMAQYHCFLVYSPQQDGELQTVLDGIYNSVQSVRIESDPGDAKEPPESCKRPRPKNKN